MARGDSRQALHGRTQSDVVSLIAPNCTITGDIYCDGAVRIDGTVTGSIKTTKAVVISATGRVTGDIDTQDAVIGGQIVGTVTCGGKLELQESCQVEGDIHSKRVKLDEGGQVDGRFQMSEPVSPASGADQGSSKTAGATKGSASRVQTASRTGKI